jgi:hypothetical protein
MTTDPPPPSSPWATYCPDAFPVEWFDGLGLTSLPVGFTRFATADESALIAGAISAGEFLDRTGARKPPRSPSPPRGKVTPKKRPEGRFAVLNGFVDSELRKLSRAEIAVWLVLYRDTKPDGTARTGQTDIARRAGCDARTVRRALGTLGAKGLVEVVTKGKLRTGPSRYRVLGIAPVRIE